MVTLRLAVLVAALLPFLVLSQQEGPIDPYGKPPKKKMHKTLLGIKRRYDDYLDYTNYTRGGWDTAYIPEDCAYFAKKNGVEPKDMVVYNVSYVDCPDPWFMCLHNGIEDHVGLIDTFGRVPVHMRSWVKHLIAFPISLRPRLSKKKRQMATQSTGNIILWGPVKEWIDIMLHQVAHSLDLNGAYGPALSSSEVWDQAIRYDRRVPSNLSKKNRFESVAENTIMAVYFKALGVETFLDLPPQEVDDGRPSHSKPHHREPVSLGRRDRKRLNNLRHQQDLLDTLGRRSQGKGVSLFAKGGSCTRRVLPSTPIHVETDTTGPPDGHPPPEAVLSPGIEAIELRSPGTHSQYECPYPEGK